MTYASHPDVDSGKAVTIPFCLGFEGNTDPKAEAILDLTVIEENAIYPFLANWRRGMKLNHFFLLISLVILGFACPLSASVTPTNPAVPTSITPTPAIPTTSIPATNVPTTSQTSIEATVASTLTTAGPYLVYVRDQGNGQELVLMDADGKGEKTFPFPMNNNLSTPRLLSNMVSPDGLWLAYYTGSAGPAFGQVGPNSADLTLNLMSLFGGMAPVGSTQIIAHLLSVDYPVNFAQAAQQLDIPDISAQSLQDAFVNGIAQSIAWSPDGLYLAFAGQMDGLSSDLYLYNASDGTIQRMSSGPEEVQWIDWSPDGKWILDGSCDQVGEGMTYNVYATSRDGRVVRTLIENSTLAGEPTWINAHAFLVWQSQNGPGNFGLERVDVESGNVTMIWNGSFDWIAVDPAGSWLALHAWTSGISGLSLINLATLASTRVKVPDMAHIYGVYQDMLGTGSAPDRLFLTRDETDLSLYYLSTDGVMTPAGTSANLFSVAPNHAGWIAIKDNIQLFLENGSQTNTFTLPDGMKGGDFQQIIWRPDSSGIFLLSSANRLYALDFLSGISTLVGQSLIIYPAGPEGLIWVHK